MSTDPQTNESLTFEQSDTAGLALTAFASGPRATIEISDDWHGDSGTTILFELTPEQAESLRDWLDGFLAE